jgi:hypothetical protein
MIHLRVGDGSHVYVSETIGLSGEDAALSHCWGGLSGLKTTSKNISDHKTRGLLVEAMTPTPWDAVQQREV